MSISPKFPPTRIPCGDLEEVFAHHAMPLALLRAPGYHHRQSRWHFFESEHVTRWINHTPGPLGYLIPTKEHYETTTSA